MKRMKTMRDENDETVKVKKTEGKTMRDENDETAKVKKTEGKTMRDETTEHEVTNGTTTMPALTTSAPLAPAPKWSDGFDDDDGCDDEGIIKGMRLKFGNDNAWVDRDGNLFAKDRELVAYEVKKAVQTWPPGGGKPKSRILGPGEPFPNIEKLNAEAPKSEWREAFGTMKGPNENVYVVYLFDQKKGKIFTYLTKTVGGFRAVRELKDEVRRIRMLEGDNRYPVVTLTDTFMKTGYGGRQRPEFNIVRYTPIGGHSQAEPLPGEPKTGGGQAMPLLEEPEPKPEEPKKPEPPFDDEIGL